MSKENGVVITSAVRTAIGDLGGSLKNVSAHKLGSTAISNAIKKSNIKASDINEIIMGQVLTRRGLQILLSQFDSGRGLHILE